MNEFLSNPYFYLLCYFIAVNIIGFILPAADKSKSRKGQWRIPEKHLFLIAIIGGSVSEYISMRIYHHKTKHKRFMIGIPVIIFLQAVIAAFVFIPALRDLLKKLL